MILSTGFTTKNPRKIDIQRPKYTALYPTGIASPRNVNGYKPCALTGGGVIFKTKISFQPGRLR